jgi:hypothetical protein
MTYELMAKEFPEYDQATLPDIPDSWVDTSWHNDTCPSFFNEDAKLTIHIDFAKPIEREFPGSEGRFIVMVSTAENDGPNDLLQTNDWQAVLDLVAERACPRVNGGHRDTGRGVCAHCGKVLA